MGVAAGVIVLLLLATVAGVLLFCVLKKRKAKEGRPVDLINMNTPMQPQQINNGSNAYLVPKPGMENGAYGPEKPVWDPIPIYISPSWQQQPVNLQGQTLIELQILALEHQGPPRGPVYELH